MRKQQVRRKLNKKGRRFLDLLLMWLIVLGALCLMGYLFINEEARGEPVLGTISTDIEPDPVDRRVDLPAIYAEGTQVVLDETQASEAHLAAKQGQVARVVSSQTIDWRGRYDVAYDLKFSEEDLLYRVLESELKPAPTKFIFDQTVKVPGTNYYAHDGKIQKIWLTAEGTRYTVDFGQAGTLSDLTDMDLGYIYQLKLVESNTAAQNNALIQEAFEASKAYAFTLINFPTGNFKIGSAQPDVDYLRLPSNVELRGNSTSLVVEGEARWYGFATGPSITEGVSNFSMTGLIIRASNLTAGNQFIIMANHGSGWYIANNRFIMVHKKSSHVFDLGGVDNALFHSNQFVGYAPELTHETKVAGQRTSHNFYSEAIQLDMSSGESKWDGDFLRKIDPNYFINNPYEIMSQRITIENNQFLPYYDESGQLIARSATVGQHSSDIGAAEFIGNYFETPLVLNVTPPKGEEWLFKPVHYPKGSPAVETNNQVVN